MEKQFEGHPFYDTGRAEKSEGIRRRALAAISNSERLLDASNRLLTGPSGGPARRYKVMRDFESLRAGEVVAEEHLPSTPSRVTLIAEGFLMENDYRLADLRLIVTECEGAESPYERAGE